MFTFGMIFFSKNSREEYFYNIFSDFVSRSLA